jgi:hypothetical protein
MVFLSFFIIIYQLIFYKNQLKKTFFFQTVNQKKSLYNFFCKIFNVSLLSVLIIFLSCVRLMILGIRL